MWWLLIFPALATFAVAYILHWLDKTKTRRSINQMADNSRRQDAYGAIRLY